VKFLEALNIFGWHRNDENVMLYSLLTGDPLLMLAQHGTAKTAVAIKMAMALDVPHIAYDASKAQFEDVIGFPDAEEYKKGIIKYLPSPQTIWDKDFVFIDEVGRAKPAMQNKWLEVIRSRRVMGFQTDVRWVWGAMNPVTYIGAQQLDEAFIGRFASFIFPPDVMEMEEKDRLRVLQNVDFDDAPAVKFWLNEEQKEEWAHRVSNGGLEEAREALPPLMRTATELFLAKSDDHEIIMDFVSKLADLLKSETRNEVKLDGRRLGFIFRNILAGIAIEQARDTMWGETPNSIGDIVTYVVKSSLPIGLNAEENAEEMIDKAEGVINTLSDVFQQGSDLDMINKIYELFTTSSPTRKLDILINYSDKLTDMIKSRAWNRLAKTDYIGPFALFAMKCEVEKPGTIPPELLKTVENAIAVDLPTDTWFSLEMEELNRQPIAESIIKLVKNEFELVAAYHIINGHTDKSEEGFKKLHEKVSAELAHVRKVISA